MNFVIYSIGDSAFLEQILNAVAMLSGSGNIGSAAAVGALIGVLVVFVQSAVDGGKGIAFQQILVGWLFYMAMFGPTASVTIEDAANGHVRVVDNVPIGVAAPGFVISRLGHGITEAFEQAYAPITGGLAHGGNYADALKSIVNIREKAHSAQVWGALDQLWGGGQANVQKSFEAYLRECTLTKFDLGLASTVDLKTKNILSAIEFQSSIYYTQLYRSTATIDVTCSEAFVELESLLVGQLNAGSDEFQDALNSIVGVETGNPAGNNWNSSISTSIAELGMLGTSAQKMMVTALVEPILLEAAQGKYDNFQDTTLAISLTNAIEQRNISWAASKSLFEETIRPLMTFFEGFIYGITPFIAILVLMGSFGLKLGFKYFTVIIWIQLWFPLLSIVDLYISMSAAREVGQAITSTGEPGSIYMLNAAYDSAKTWIGIGSYMASSIPMISFFLVSGSAYAMSGLASGIQSQMSKGADQAASNVQPDAMSVGALSSVMAGGSANWQTGTALSGGEAPSFNMSSIAQSQVSSARGGMIETQNAFSKELESSLKNAEESGTGTQVLSSVGAQLSGSKNQTVQSAQQQAQNFQQQYGLSDTQTEAITGALALTASGGLTASQGLDAIGGISGNLSGQGSAKDQSSDAFTQDMKAALGNAENNSLAESQSASLAQTVSNAVQQADTSSYSDSQTQSDMIKVKKSASELEKASQSYQEASTWGSSLSTQNVMDGKTLAGQVDRDGGFSDLYQWLDQNSDSSTAKAFEQRAETLRQVGYGDENDSRQVAALETMLRSGDTEAQQLAQGAIASATGYSLPDPSAAHNNAGLGSDLDDVPLEDKLALNAMELNGVQGPPSADIPGTPEGLFDGASADARGDYFGNLGSEKGAAAAEAAIARQAENPRSHTSAFGLMGMGDTGGDLLSQAQMAANGAYEGGSVFVQEFGAALADGNERAHQLMGDLSGMANEGMGSILGTIQDSGLFSAATLNEIGNQTAGFVGAAVAGSLETGQATLAGFSEAAMSGLHAGANYMSENYDGMRQEFFDQGQSFGLTDAQSAVFADARMHMLAENIFPGGVAGSGDALQESISGLSAGYSNQDLAGNMADVIVGQAENPRFAGGGLSSIAMHNAAAGPDLPGSFSMENMSDESQDHLREYIQEAIEGMR
ncbi:conjugal transfer protein TraG N-terminal domain-containing protein [Hydrocarboniclastica marina]|uniref:Conjugal transfer protein TraG n=1 Tax=Hydrocarboniclastica marina TaxID=2259620 RepID=A0A4P7XLM9_9ALTE|nr:conjugal transfer protein TraG N-terminal domain-containing protein [Hydrocarboniclastica marina]QCF28081.1 conjugal transfer protein TraG [Hydrocarboniclastica marina]